MCVCACEWICAMVNLYTALTTKNCQDFVVTERDCHNNNSWCQHWWQSCHHADSQCSTCCLLAMFIPEMQHDDVIKWKTFSMLLALCEGNHWSPVDSPHEGQWCGALMFSLIRTRTTRTPALWGQPQPPHDYPHYWVMLDPKSKLGRMTLKT